MAFTSNLCSAAGTITERPDFSANVHHIDSRFSLSSYIYIHFLLVRLGSVANLKLKEEEKSGVNLTCS